MYDRLSNDNCIKVKTEDRRKKKLKTLFALYKAMIADFLGKLVFSFRSISPKWRLFSNLLPNMVIWSTIVHLHLAKKFWRKKHHVYSVPSLTSLDGIIRQYRSFNYSVTYFKGNQSNTQNYFFNKIWNIFHGFFSRFFAFK